MTPRGCPDLLAAGVRLFVSPHAQWRAAEHFAMGHTEDLEREVYEAFSAGRASTTKPPGVLNETQPDALYCWTPAGERVYVLKVNRRTRGADFAVLTVIAPRARTERSHPCPA